LDVVGVKRMHQGIRALVQQHLGSVS
jgi:hypothetical protein